MAARVGIIANPAAAHDLRRLSGSGSIVANHEKVRILRRVLLGLQAVGVDEALVMPDPYGLGRAAAATSDLTLPLRILPLHCQCDATDTTRAAASMAAEGCTCIVTLGGDGTNRAAAKGCGDVPLLAIATGTNAVIPRPIEGTTAGMAAAVCARGLVDAGRLAQPTKRLEVLRAGQVVDTALVDVALSVSPFLGARAITDPADLRRLWLAQAVPGSIGLAAIGASLHPLTPLAAAGLALDLTPGDGAEARSSDQAPLTVMAAIAPGVVRSVRVRGWRMLRIGECVPVEPRYGTLALDGERSLLVPAEPALAVRIRWTGPRLLDALAVLDEAARKGVFITHHASWEDSP